NNDSGELNRWCLDVAVSKTLPVPEPTPPPPVLPDSAYVSGMHGHDQAMPLDCETRAAVDWAHHFGVSIGEYEFFNQLPVSDDPDSGFVGDPFGLWGQIPPDPYGVHAAPIAVLLKEYGLKAGAYSNLSWDDLRAEIAAGRPAIVWVIGDSSGYMPGAFYPFYYTASNEHTSVVSPYEHTVNLIAYTPQSVTILDGSKIYTRSLDQFLISWSVLRNMAVLGR
ncbi:MAG: C39 family peptidase, partial [Omnitrophica WOR_2 bacterium]